MEKSATRMYLCLYSRAAHVGQELTLRKEKIKKRKELSAVLRTYASGSMALVPSSFQIHWFQQRCRQKVAKPVGIGKILPKRELQPDGSETLQQLLLVPTADQQG